MQSDEFSQNPDNNCRQIQTKLQINFRQRFRKHSDIIQNKSEIEVRT